MKAFLPQVLQSPVQRQRSLWPVLRPPHPTPLLCPQHLRPGVTDSFQPPDPVPPGRRGHRSAWTSRQEVVQSRGEGGSPSQSPAPSAQGRVEGSEPGQLRTGQVPAPKGRRPPRSRINVPFGLLAHPLFTVKTIMTSMGLFIFEPLYKRGGLIGTSVSLPFPHRDVSRQLRLRARESCADS